MRFDRSSSNGSAALGLGNANPKGRMAKMERVLMRCILSKSSTEDIEVKEERVEEIDYWSNLYVVLSSKRWRGQPNDPSIL